MGQTVFFEQNTEAATDPKLSGAVWGGLNVEDADPGTYNIAVIDVAGHSDEDGVLTSGHVDTLNTSVPGTIRAIGSGTTAFPFLRFSVLGGAGTGATSAIRNDVWAQAGRGPRLEPPMFYLASGVGHIPVHFEARIKRATLGANVGMFFGLTDDAAILDGNAGSGALIFASGGLAGRLCGDQASEAANNYTGRGCIGFRISHLDPDNIIPVHLDGDETVNLTDTALSSGIDVMVADTWVKLGFRTVNNGAGRIFGVWYVNGSEVARANINQTSFPFNQALKLRFYVYGTATASGTVDLHWAKAVQRVAVAA